MIYRPTKLEGDTHTDRHTHTHTRPQPSPGSGSSACRTRSPRPGASHCKPKQNSLMPRLCFLSFSNITLSIALQMRSLRSCIKQRILLHWEVISVSLSSVLYNYICLLTQRSWWCGGLLSLHSSPHLYWHTHICTDWHSTAQENFPGFTFSSNTGT